MIPMENVEYWVGFAGPFNSRDEATIFQAVLASPEPVYVVDAATKKFVSF